MWTPRSVDGTASQKFQETHLATNLLNDSVVSRDATGKEIPADDGGGTAEFAQQTRGYLPKAGNTLSDDNSELEPPDPIPNSAVKRFSADGSVGFPHVRVGHRQALFLTPGSIEPGVFLCAVEKSCRKRSGRKKRS